MKTFLSFIGFFLLGALGAESNEPQEDIEVNPESAIESQAEKAIEALKNEDFETFTDSVHPEEGIRFSPYAYVDTEEHQHFSREQMHGLMEKEKAYLWGTYDGTGDPIRLSPLAYYDRFMYQKDFINAEEIRFDDDIEPRGNSLHNTEEIYPEAHFIEFYVSGSEEYSHMDWGSLILAFEEHNGEWYIVGYIQDEWTI